MYPLTKRANTRLTNLRRVLPNNRDTLPARSIAMLEWETRFAEIHVRVLTQIDQAEGSAATD